MMLRYVAPSSNSAAVTLWQLENCSFFAPVASQTVSASFWFYSSMQNTTGMRSVRTLSIKNATVAADGSAASAQPG